MIRGLILGGLLVGCATDPATEEGPTAELESCHPATVDAVACDPDAVSFTLDSTNPWYPLVPGSLVSLEGLGEGDEAGIGITVERRVLRETREIGGVEVHVLEHKKFFDGVINEIAMNFYVETTGGTVCYFGEDVEFYDENGDFADTHGTWRVGEDGAKPGVIMPESPEVGDAYYQELAPGIALDMGRVDEVGLTAELQGTTFDVIRVIDTNPIDDEEPCHPEEKRYARGIGEIQDTVLHAVSFELP